VEGDIALAADVSVVGSGGYEALNFGGVVCA
jgi:hypothetical protein